MVNAPTVGSLFSGIGGLDLGLERAGFRVAWQCESDPYARAVLRKHWPDVPCYDDVRKLDGSEPAVDLLCGDSPAKTLASLGNERELMANVAGFGVHTREPLTYFDRTSLSWRTSQGSLLVGSDVFSETWPNAGTMRNGTVYARPTSVLRIGESGSSLLPTPNASDWQSICWHRCERLIRGLNGREAGAQGWVHEPPRQHGRWLDAAPEARIAAAAWEHAPCEPVILGVPDGICGRLDRIRTLGNAVVPQVAEWIGAQIMTRFWPRCDEEGAGNRSAAVGPGPLFIGSK